MELLTDPTSTIPVLRALFRPELCNKAPHPHLTGTGLALRTRMSWDSR